MRVARRAGKAIALLALCAAAGEVALRIAGTALPAVRYLAAPRQVRDAEPQTIAELQRAFDFQMEPGRVFYDFRCNSLGFHDAEFRASIAPETLRIAVLGDSFAHAMVPYWDSYLTHAEVALVLRALGGRPALAGAPPPVEIDNLGVPATGIEDYRSIYRLVGRALHPDVVVVNLYMGNDLVDFADGHRYGPARRAWLRSWLATALVRMARLARERWYGAAAVQTEALPVGDGRVPPGRALPGHHAWSDDAPPFSLPHLSDAGYRKALSVELAELGRPGSAADRHDWHRIRSALDELIGAIELDGVAVVLALAPSRLQVDDAERIALARELGLPPDDFDPDAPRRWLAEYARARSLPLVDLTDRLRAAHAAGERLYRPNDTHWGVRGNRAAGEELARGLAELGLTGPKATVAAR